MDSNISKDNDVSGNDNEDDIFNGGQGTGSNGTQWEWAMQLVLVILRMMAEQKCRRGDGERAGVYRATTW